MEVRRLQRIDYCVAFECHQGALDDPRPLCDKHWNGLRPSERGSIALLLESDPLAARVLASLVAELPVRDMSHQVIDELGTFGTVRDSIADRDGYELDVQPWRELVDSLFWQVNEHTGLITAGRPWLGLEIALAMARTRTGVDQWQPLLIAAAVEFDEARGENYHLRPGCRKPQEIKLPGSKRGRGRPRTRLRYDSDDPELVEVLEEHAGYQEAKRGA